MTQPPQTGRVASPTPSRARGAAAAVWNAVCAAIGAVMGLLPHVLHHAGLVAGAALVTGLGGNLLFAGLGLLFSLPLLRRLHRRFETWKAPAIAIGVFATMFAVSALVIGPAVSETSPADPPGTPGDPSPSVGTPAPGDHDSHHPR